MIRDIDEEHRRQSGFALTELMVVVLVIGILVAIAVPAFLGSRARSQNRAAQSDLRNALFAAKTIYSTTSSYATANNTATGLTTVEPSLVYVAAGTVSNVTTRRVSVSAAAATWGAARMSASGRCYTIKETTTTRTRYGMTLTAANCRGTWAVAGTNTNSNTFP